MKTTVLMSAWALGVAGSLLFGCHAAPTGPVALSVVGSPPSNVVIDPRLQTQVQSPNATQAYSYTDSNHLKYTFQLQNTSNVPIALRYKTTFFDDSGITTVDEQLPKRLFLNEYEIEPITVVCSNADGRKVRVQVSAAD